MKKENQISFDRLIAKYFQSSDKATILQDLRHFNQSKINNNKLRHGLPLVYYSCNEVTATKFEHINERTLRRYLSQLTKDGILFSTVCNPKKYDKTKSYIVNFAYYDAISNGIEYPITDKEKFTKLCGEIVKNTEIDCKVLKIDNGQFVRDNRNEPKTHGQIDQTHGQIDRTFGQIDQPIPTNKTLNNSIINKKLRNDKTVLVENTKNTVYTTEQLKVINEVKEIFKNQFGTIQFYRNSNKSIIEIIKHLQANLKAYNDTNNIKLNITLKPTYKALETILKVIAKRIKATDTDKHNLNYFKTIILNEPPKTYIDDTAKLLSLASPEVTAKYYKISARDGKEIANEILRKVLKQHKI